jgi:hypothetical protein
MKKKIIIGSAIFMALAVILAGKSYAVKSAVIAAAPPTDTIEPALGSLEPAELSKPGENDIKPAIEIMRPYRELAPLPIRHSTDINIRTNSNGPSHQNEPVSLKTGKK